MQNENEQIYATFQTVEVTKDKLLDVIKKNREKHNFLYNASVSGYYQKVDEWKGQISDFALNHAKEFNGVSKRLNTFAKTTESSSNKYDFGKPVDPEVYPSLEIKLPSRPSYPSFPISYENSYNDAITKLELSIHGNFKLSEQEFQQYVMNNWTWRTNFVNNSIGLCSGMNVYTTGAFLFGNSISGCLTKF